MERCINGDNFSCRYRPEQAAAWLAGEGKKKQKTTTVGFTGRQKELEFKALVYLYEWKAPQAMAAFSHWHLESPLSSANNVESGFILTSCALVNMHIVACLTISIFSCTPLGAPLSLQGRQPPMSVICPRGSHTHWINMSLVLLPLHLSKVKVCIYKNSKSISNQNLFLRIVCLKNTTEKANRTAFFLHVTVHVCLCSQAECRII